MRRHAELKALLATPRRIVVTAHHNPDGDAIGSALALYHYLDKHRHQVKVIMPNEYPRFLHWIPGHNEVVIFEKKREEAKKLIADAEFIFSLDYNALKRTQDMEEPLRAAKAIKVLIDHHPEPEAFADYELHSTTASSTAELIFDFITLMGGTARIDNNIAACLYTGLLTDTGSFQFASTTPKVHRIVADLMELGLDSTDIYERIYHNSTENRLRFFGYCWNERMYIDRKNHYAIIDVPVRDQLRYHLQRGDTEGLVNTPMQIDGIHMCVMATEQEGYVKLSFRSKGDIDVNLLAREHFDGGGHRNAAGGKSMVSLAETVEQLKKVVPDYLTKTVH